MSLARLGRLLLAVMIFVCLPVYGLAGASLVSITVTPPHPALAPGAKLPFSATGQYSDGSSADLTFSASWTSSSGAASISNQAGSKAVATGVSAGSATISATISTTQGTIKGSTSVSVANTSIRITPRIVPVTFRATVQFKATTTVAWYVDNVLGGNSTVGMISTSGKYTAPARAGIHQVRAVASGSATGLGTALVIVTNYGGVLTGHNGNTRQGQNTQEKLLAPWNINVNSFGKVFSYTLEGQVYAQPLYVPYVTVAGHARNLVFVATEHDIVYAFDADGAQTSPVWRTSFIDPTNGITSVPSADVSCSDTTPEYGITGTPVVDRGSSTLYVVSKTKENGSYVQRLHALDLATGLEKQGSPVRIQVTVPGTGVDAVSGVVTFQALQHNQRAGLLLLNGTVYIAWGSHCDHNPYHGWILGYSASTLTRTTVFNATPDGSRSGIWQMGGGLAADAAGDIYVESGNGSFDVDNGGRDYGSSVIKLATGVSGLQPLQFFAPHDESTLNSKDWDLGSGGVLVLPDQNSVHVHLLLASGKTGMIYLVDRDSLGGYNAQTDQVVQEIKAGVATTLCCDGGFWSTPAYWKQNIYIAGKKDVIKVFHISNGLLNTSPSSHGSVILPGGPVSVSAVGSNNGVAWFLDSSANALRAYNAANLATELYDTSKNATRDAPGTVVKYSEATVANGRVYVGTSNRLVVYGLLP